MYKADELIKCCKQYPVPYHIQSKGVTWIECENCRKRSVNVALWDIPEATRAWNELMLNVRDPRRQPEGKGAILSMVDLQGLSLFEVAERIDVKKTSIGQVVARIREEIDIEEDEGSGVGGGGEEEA